VRRSLLAVLAAVLVLAAGSVAVLDVTGRLPGGLVADSTPTPTPTVTLDPPRSPAPAVLEPEPTATGGTAAVPEAALDEVLAAPALAAGAGATVVDVGSGQVVFDRDAGTPRVPASVAKLLTGAAVLSAYPPGHRLTTQVLAGTPGQVVLVGAGDATLTTRPRRPSDLPQRGSLVALADQTQAALTTGAGPPGQVTVAVDDHLFTGPAVSPDWPATYVSSGVVAPVSALSVDDGRVRPGSDVREADPALAAGRELARLLRRRGLDVAPEVTRAVAPAGSDVLAEVTSPTVGEMVELALQTSDNDLAEALARLAALGQGLPATFEGAQQAVLDGLAGLGVPTDGVTLLDGSGLARGSTVPPVALASVLRVAADGSHPELAPLLDGLPVAGFSGTLALRYREPPQRFGAGLVRAKTGTLTGVSALAGTTTVAGRPVVFVVMADRVPADATLAARDDLDRFAAVLSGAAAGKLP
jgi:serine-type D-Ala-D-Ala carboxypeptidase/endopeptidase (penicillin-binding protein 4)